MNWVEHMESGLEKIVVVVVIWPVIWKEQGKGSHKTFFQA